jgi:hypothetical protein
MPLWGVRYDANSLSVSFGEAAILQSGIVRVDLPFVSSYIPQNRARPERSKVEKIHVPNYRRDAQKVPRRPGSDLEPTVTSEQNLGWFETAKLIIYHVPCPFFGLSFGQIDHSTP